MGWSLNNLIHVDTKTKGQCNVETMLIYETKQTLNKQDEGRTILLKRFTALYQEGILRRKFSVGWPMSYWQKQGCTNN